MTPTLKRRVGKSLRRFRLRCRRAVYRRSSRRRLVGLAALIAAGGIFLVLRCIFSPAPTLEESPVDYRILVYRYARRADLPASLVHKIVLAESSADPRAVSRVNAKGLMQIMPAAEIDSLKRLPGVARGDLFDPEYNLMIGTTYLRILTNRFGGDAHLVLAAYHMGPTKVSRYLSANPGISGRALVQRFAGPATRAYCAKVLQGQALQLRVTSGVR